MPGNWPLEVSALMFTCTIELIGLDEVAVVGYVEAIVARGGSVDRSHSTTETPWGYWFGLGALLLSTVEIQLRSHFGSLVLLRYLTSCNSWPHRSSNASPPEVRTDSSLVQNHRKSTH